MRLCTSLVLRFSSVARRPTTSGCLATSLRTAVSTRESRLSTSTRPWRSRMRPRGAGWYTMRTWLLLACTWKLVLSITCRYQSRENKAANSDSTMIPNTPSRNEDVPPPRMGMLMGRTSPGEGGGGPSLVGPLHQSDDRDGEDAVDDGDPAGDDGQIGVQQLRLADGGADEPVEHDAAGAGDDRGEGRDPPRG